MKKFIETLFIVILVVVVIASCFYFINTSPWFEIGDTCPDGQERVVTVWNQGEVNERVDTMCVTAGK
jgi:hypothetical protein